VDGLRAAAVMAVLLMHCAPAIFPGGFIGVDLFFVISGYVISLSLLKEHARRGAISIAGFYRRRALRILPPLLAVVAAVLLLGALVGDAWSPTQSRRDEWIEALLALTSTMNWSRALRYGNPGFLGHLWSLSVEEQFYLVWPPLLLLLLRTGNRRLIAALLPALILLSFVWRTYLASVGAAPERMYLGLDTRADSLMLGCLLAVAGTGSLPRRLLKCWIIPAAILALLLLFASWDQPWLGWGGFTLLGILATWLVASAVEAGPTLRTALTLRPVQWIGLRSYSLYLWQVPVLGIVGLFGLPPPYAAAATFGSSLIVAALSYRLFEQTFGRRPRPGAPVHRAGEPA
jgi:peptidoglycan/LPS O-acetylase OafA/YrhL